MSTPSSTTSTSPTSAFVILINRLESYAQKRVVDFDNQSEVSSIQRTVETLTDQINAKHSDYTKDFTRNFEVINSLLNVIDFDPMEDVKVNNQDVYNPLPARTNLINQVKFCAHLYKAAETNASTTELYPTRKKPHSI